VLANRFKLTKIDRARYFEIVITIIFLNLTECRLALQPTDEGLALLGYLKNVSRQLKPNIILKVEDNN
jgi:hypothetical protein